METHPARRIEIIIEAALLSRLTDALEEAGVTGYTVLPVLGGFGRSGAWTREGQVGPGDGMAAVVCILGPGREGAILEAAYAVLARHIGVVSVTDCEVVRRDRF